MPLKFALNLSLVFAEMPFLARFKAAADAGFRYVEFFSPYEFDTQTILDAAQQHGLQTVLINMPAGNWAAGERGIGCHPDRVDEFKRGVAQAINYALHLGVKQINCLSGLLPAGVSADVAQQTYLNNIRGAAAQLAAHGLTLTLEPINTRDNPGYFLHHTEQAAELIAQAGCDNIKIQYDIYHRQRMQGELINGFLAHQAQISHVQIADNPRRGEPGSGEIQFENVFAALIDADYSGYVSFEYNPQQGSSAGITQVQALMRRFS